LYAEYARINKWNWGHAVVEISKTGKYNMNNYKQLAEHEVVRV
jgi:hypothetical protein